MVSTYVSIYFGIIPQLGHTIKANCIKIQIADREICSMFLEKDLGLVPPTYFVYGFSRKLGLTLYSINWPNFNDWLRLLFEILGNMGIVTINFLFDTSEILKLAF